MEKLMNKTEKIFGYDNFINWDCFYIYKHVLKTVLFNY